MESYIIIKITKTNRERKQATAHVCKRIRRYMCSPMTIRKGAVNFRIIVFHQLPDAIFGCSSISCLIKLSYCLFASTNWLRKLISTFCMFITSQKNRNYEKTVLKNIVLCLTIAKDSTWFMILQMDVEDMISFSEVSGERSVLLGKQLLSAMNTQWKLKWKCRTACFISQLFEKVLRGLIIFSVLILLHIYIKTLLGKKVS